ncbi:MAG: L-2-amino-thiazoline-4-carboxylic acid hydrolase [Deltaproteobacteria bacterium]|jgi:hypothetical protein|nr:L-2-amino-thiazoline-4-carboxylic acid hydrolase [Deltaproteobacteria bacterium]
MDKINQLNTLDQIDNAKASSPETPLLERRRIEAEIIKPIYQILKERLGETEAKETVGLAIKQVARATGQKLAQDLGGTLANLIALQPMWGKGGALKVKILTQDDERFDYDVIHCAYAELYQQMGLKDLGFILSCERDGAFIEGFAPDIELTRTQTLMTGGSCCDFRYRLNNRG